MIKHTLQSFSDSVRPYALERAHFRIRTEGELQKEINVGKQAKWLASNHKLADNKRVRGSLFPHSVPYPIHTTVSTHHQR